MSKHWVIRVAGYGSFLFAGAEEEAEEMRRHKARWPARLSAPILAADNTAMAFWQSRHNLRHTPQLTDLRALARVVRGAYA
ncbi:hypothetical protein [Xanthomonas translucens]|uniref:hypothetical protein n=1 Tax=Xanthomonas campestris pv. translucens TaxID=343 RepID=UPI00071E8680|nr:hypothetical protein [Xanthomonas translucens]